VPPGSKIVGRVVNKTGRPLNDLTVAVVRTGTGEPPTHGGSTVVGQGAGGSNSAAAKTDDPEGFQGTAGFGGASQAPVMGVDMSYEIEIPVANAGTSSMLEVRLTPSVKPTGSELHADLLTSFHLASDRIAATHRMLASAHPRTSAHITNENPRTSASEHIVALSGSVLLAGGAALTGVQLLDPSQGGPVPNAAVALQGGSFSITGFHPLEPGRTLELVLHSSAVPGPDLRVALEALFAPPE
jgi:hypothetical protein